MPSVPELQSVTDDAVRPERADVQPPLSSGVWTSDASTSYQLDANCQDFITRYLGRSLMNTGDPNMMEVNRKLLKLAFIVSLLYYIYQGWIR